MKLSLGQEKVLAFIARHTADIGYPPTLREISKHMGSTSSNAAHCWVQALIGRGAVRRQANISRGITITEDGHAYLEHVSEEHVIRRQLG